MRLINLDALNKYPIRRHRCDKKNANPHFINGIESVLEYANELPVVEERKHGHWVRHNNIIACSECIWDMYWEEGNTELNYCPNCGAIMDGDEKMTELKPCPFCGGKVEIENIGEKGEKVYMITCQKCCVGVTFSGQDDEPGAWDLNKKETIVAWNRREGEER